MTLVYLLDVFFNGGPGFVAGHVSCAPLDFTIHVPLPSGAIVKNGAWCLNEGPLLLNPVALVEAILVTFVITYLVVGVIVLLTRQLWIAGHTHAQ